MADTSASSASALTFSFPAYELRTVMRDGEPWFVAADVCDALGIQNITQAVARLDDDERAMFNIGRQGDASVINESGLYSLILGSRKPEAKKFKKWVTAEVLPAIRRSGRYEHAAAPAPTATALPAPDMERRLAAAEQQIAQLSRSVIRAQSRLINAQSRTLAVAARLEKREARQTIIEMERRGEPRERIVALTGRNSNHVRQVIWQARQAGMLHNPGTAPSPAPAQAELALDGEVSRG